MSNLNLYRIEKDKIRHNLNKYTKKAFKMLPNLIKPHILDVGCGSGVPTLELAKISDGQIVGIDIDDISLNMFKRKIKEAGLSHRVRIIKNSIKTMDFPKESFNIIWAEGSLFVMGFEKSIKNWYRLLKPNGFLVIHDEDKDKIIKLDLIKKYNYKIIGKFDLSDNLWFHDYYNPLENLIQDFNIKYPNDSELIEELNKDQIEINKCKSKSIIYSSFFVILQKI